MSLDSYYFGCNLTCLSLPCSKQGKSHPSLAENVLCRGFVARKDCTKTLLYFTLTSTAFFFVIADLLVLVKIPNWWRWSPPCVLRAAAVGCALFSSTLPLAAQAQRDQHGPLYPHSVGSGVS